VVEKRTHTVFVSESKRITMPVATASTTEEPDAEKLHVRVCAGGAR
jgi:hypothetical protein